MGNGDGTFRVRATYPVAVQPFYAAGASFRGSGILDLVVQDTLGDFVYVMLGNGDGTFQPAIPYPTTAESYMVSVGDFTGDGKIDVVTTEGYNVEGTDDCNCVEILPGNGDGTLGPPVTTPLPGGLTGYAITTSDFNDILLGNGDGTFNAAGDYLVSNVPLSIAAGYFTSNKKKIDLAVANTEGASLSVLVGNGAGGFLQSSFYETEAPT